MPKAVRGRLWAGVNSQRQCLFSAESPVVMQWAAKTCIPLRFPRFLAVWEPMVAFLLGTETTALSDGKVPQRSCGGLHRVDGGRSLQRIIDTIGPAQADEPVTVALAEHEAGVRGAAEARGAGDHVHGGAIIELPQMMYQQHGNAVPVRQPFERTNVPVVVGVGTHIIVHGADALQSVDDYLTNIEESPGGIALQCLRDFAIIFCKSG